MTKAEFLKQENVPQFIKDLVSVAPDDAQIEMDVTGVRKGENKKSSCNCEGCGTCYEDGLDISDHMESIADQLVTIIDNCDDQGNLKNDPKALQQTVIALGIVQHVSAKLSDYILEHSK